MDNEQINNSDTQAIKTDLETQSVATADAETMGKNGLEPSLDHNLQQTSRVQDQPSGDDIIWPQDIPFETAQIQAFKTLAQELNLSQKQAQKLVDFETKFARENQRKETEEKRDIIADWARQTKALYGANLEEEISFALRAANAFGGPEFRALLEDTGLGNHPVMIRTLVGIGHSISEDACPGGQPAAPQDKTFAEALYGKQ